MRISINNTYPCFVKDKNIIMASNIPLSDEWFSYDPTEAIEFIDGVVLLDATLKKSCDPYKKEDHFDLVLIDFSRSYVQFFEKGVRKTLSLKIN